MRAPLLPDSKAPVGVTGELLPHVSRTFALTIPVLEQPLRDQVAVAYLLCRIADTIEDAAGIPASVRGDLFACFTEMVRRPRDAAYQRRFLKTWCGRVDPYHDQLMRRCGDVLAAYADLPPGARRPIQECLQEMVSGMAAAVDCDSDPAIPHEVCATLGDLERYCHIVAGTVGILLTHLFAQELPESWPTASRAEQGRRFGLGLQLTNVLKDAEGDRRRGISYIPPKYLSPPGAKTLISLALEHLDEAQAYALSLPKERLDMRLFCILASHLALATLALVAEHPQGASKVSRLQVAAIVDIARASAGNDLFLERRHRELRGAALKALGE